MLRKILGIIWAVIAVALIALLLMFLFKWKDSGASNFFRFFKISIESNDGFGGNGNMKKLTNEQTLSSTMTDLRAEVSSMGVELESTGVSGVKISCYNGAEKYLQYDLSDGVLTLKETKTFRAFAFSAPKVVIQVPSRQLNSINVQKTSGSFSATGFDVNDVYVKSSSGSIKLDDVNAKTIQAISTSGSATIYGSSYDDMTVKVSSGSVKMEGTKASKADITASSGSIKLTDVTFDSLETHSNSGSLKAEGKIGKVNATVTSGSIKLSDSIALTGESSFEAHSGSIKLYLVPSPEYFFETKVSSGSIKNNLDSNRMGSVPINIKATSGSIRVDPLN